MLLGGMVLGYKMLYGEIIKRLFPRNNLVSIMVMCTMLMEVLLRWEERRKSENITILL